MADGGAGLRWRWAPTELTRVLFASAGLALALALVSGRWQLAVFAAPMLGVLAASRWQRSLPPISIRAHPAQFRCFEGEDLTAEVELTGGPAGLEIRPPDRMTAEVVADDGTGRSTVVVSAQRWGRYPLRAVLHAVAPGGLMAATATAEIADIIVFPLTPPASTALPRSEMPDRLGTHLTRHRGPGVEYADIRPYVPGDQLRTVNWSVSARRGRLHVTERLTDRSVDVVVLIDTSAQPPGAATAATARAVEGAVQVVQSALRRGDRAGVIGLGGRRPRWLGPDIGQRQFYRVLESVLEVGGDQEMSGSLAPRAAVPPGAVVVAFSTLLESDFGFALTDLSARGHPVVVIDVLQERVFDGDDVLVDLMWKLQRSAMYRNLRSVGVNVLAWPADVGLDQVMGPLAGVRR
ncbi:MAG TPA: DUF58 domain-containing protein [Mycobacterium sp.]|nr:DUF58 domain-containing protein [Mycobacterium sp.]